MPHIHDAYDFAVSAFIVFENRVLMVNHPRYGMWIPIGGHIELDETPDQALLREIKEESGLGVDDIEILCDQPELNDPRETAMYTPRHISVHEAQAPHRHIALIYYVKSKTSAAKLSGEHTELHWLSETDLDDPAFRLEPAIKFYCRDALKAATSN